MNDILVGILGSLISGGFVAVVNTYISVKVFKVKLASTNAKILDVEDEVKRQAGRIDQILMEGR